MIAVKDKTGETNVSFAADGYIRVTGAGKAASEKERVLFSDGYRMLTGQNVRVRIGDEQVTLGTNEALLVAPETLFSCSGDMLYVDFTSSQVLFGAAYLWVPFYNGARVEALLGGRTTEGILPRLTTELVQVVAHCINTPPAPHTVTEVRAYLDKFFYLPLDVALLAQAAGYSRGYFTAKFTQEMGCSPYKYITAARLRNAKKLLQNGAASVRTVAAACGYASVERFCEMFHKHVGCSPRKYKDVSNGCQT